MEFTGCSGLCGICCTCGLPHSAPWSHDCSLRKMELMTVPSHYPQTLWSQIRSTAQHSKPREPPLTAVVSCDTSSQDSSWQLTWTSTREDLLRFLFLDSSINSPVQALLSLLNAFSLQSADLFAFLPQTPWEKGLLLISACGLARSLPSDLVLNAVDTTMTHGSLDYIMCRLSRVILAHQVYVLL